MVIRERVLRTAPLCYICKEKGIITPAKEVDHVIALVNGGTDDPENLRGVCFDCHRDKTRRDLGLKERPRIGLDGWPVD